MAPPASVAALEAYAEGTHSALMYAHVEALGVKVWGLLKGGQIEADVFCTDYTYPLSVHGNEHMSFGFQLPPFY